MENDAKLQSDVMDAIRWDPLLSSIAPNIGVTANDGVITLSGQVDTFIQKHAAEQVVKQVKGVSFVAIDIEVQIGTKRKRSDSEIAKHCKEALSHSAMVDLENLDVRVDDAWITLEGTVRWNYQRENAEAYVRNLEGIRGVTNLIALTDQPCDAKTIMEKINAAFHRHATLDASTIHVTIKGDKVVLTGTVRSWSEKKDAENAAWASPGIKAVDNLIKVELKQYVG
jgi:osmotically-inducible protein OsmY